METVLYIHGMGGSAAESAHYAPLFPGREVIGLDYRSFTPWETGAEIRAAAEALRRRGGVTLIANSIGAYFSLHAGIDGLLRKAYMISPVVDMERMIADMMAQQGVSEAELEAAGVIECAGGPALSWEYLRYVRSHPVRWEAPTDILYGSGDALVPCETVRGFAAAHRCALTVMDGGEHWFRTPEQMCFLDAWIARGEAGRAGAAADGNCNQRRSGCEN